MPVPAIRIRELNQRPLRPEGEFVLYWMIANRRARFNFALDRAIERCVQWSKPLVVLEALRVGYRWASDRMHRFVLEGMVDNAREFSQTPARYFPYVEPAPGAGKGLLEALADRACAVVTDDFPCFFLPRMAAAAARSLPVRLEAVDSNGLLPMRAADRTFSRAFDFRRFLQKALPDHLGSAPAGKPFQIGAIPGLSALPKTILERWPAAVPDEWLSDRKRLASLPIDHSVGAGAAPGGSAAARSTLRQFIEKKLPRYADERSEPQKDAASGLSPYLHFGQLSVHEVFGEVVRCEGILPETIGASLEGGGAAGARQGWWRLSPSAESFLDELVTWRELGFNMCSRREDYDQFESLPEWAQASLDAHAADPRPHVYSPEQFENARTHDELWNAAQTQLVREGRMHNYLRMLWGKKILEWSPSPRAALDVMIELNNKYAVDGRDPNSYSGIFWVLGRYDRPWGPERPIFGAVRYMSSENTARKFRVREYIDRYRNPSATLFE